MDSLSARTFILVGLGVGFYSANSFDKQDSCTTIAKESKENINCHFQSTGNIFRAQAQLAPFFLLSAERYSLGHYLFY